MKFDLLIFDWDGTLMDSAGFISRCIQAACRDMELPVPSREEASHIIGLGLREALERVAPGLAPEQYPELVEHYRRHYLSQDEHLTLFEGAEALIHELHGRGHLMAVATGKARRGLDRVFGQTGLGEWFHASRTADETFSKPHPAMVEELLDELAIAPEKALMIGDTTHDLEMARNAGIASLAAGYGAHPPENLTALGALKVCTSFPELAQWLRENA